MKKGISFKNENRDSSSNFDWGMLKRLLSYLKPHSAKLAVMYLFAMVNVGSTIMIPVMIKRGIDNHIVNSDIDGLLRIAVITTGFLVLLYVSARLQGKLMVKIGYSVLYDLRKDLFHHLQHMSFKFFDTRRTGQIMSRLTNDIQVIEQLMQAGLDTIVVDLFMIVGIIAAMISINAALSLILLVTIPALVFIVFVLRMKLIRAGRGIQSHLSNINGFLNESISGIKVIRTFAREEENINDFKEINWNYFLQTKKFYPLIAWFWQSTATLNVVGTSLVLLGGGILLSRGAVTIGVIAAFLSYINRFFQPMQKISNMMNQLSRSMASAERIFDMMDAESEITDSPDAIDNVNIRGAVEFRNVDFSYKEDEQVLRDISFSVDPGETIAIVGPTGSGKSTIISLISRFYDVDSGQVLVDGRDLREYKQTAYRSNLGLVMQDPSLFSGTIAEAVKYGKPDASMEEIESVVKEMGFHDRIVSFPEGYETSIGESGSRISLGERQLLAFARAIIRNPKILILDEASAYIDSKSEELVQQAMDKICKGRTTFVIAHRLSTIRKADRIIVIEDGEIYESGTHSELLEQDGHYAELLRTQYAALDV